MTKVVRRDRPHTSFPRTSATASVICTRRRNMSKLSTGRSALRHQVCGIPVGVLGRNRTSAGPGPIRSPPARRCRAPPSRTGSAGRIARRPLPTPSRHARPRPATATPRAPLPPPGFASTVALAGAPVRSRGSGCHLARTPRRISTTPFPHALDQPWPAPSGGRLREAARLADKIVRQARTS